MAERYNIHSRLEPVHPFEDLDRGFRAEVADPAWMLGRQWQMGEHEGENASFPVSVHVEMTEHPIDPLGGDPRWDPRLVPPETVIESEAGDWWTVGRRVRVGAQVRTSQALPAPDQLDPAVPNEQMLLECVFGVLPPPYSGSFQGTAYDGRALYERRAQLAIPDNAFPAVPVDPPDLWNPSRLAYSATFTCAGAQLVAPHHDGGRVDWYSVDGDQALADDGARISKAPIYPSQLQYPGAPASRWWEIEDHAVDIGGFPPDRAHFPTMLLVDLLVAHGDDWFSFPIQTKMGSVVSLHAVTIRDSFDDEWPLSPPTNWSMFNNRGLDARDLVVWPSVANPMFGTPLEKVIIGIDEDANKVWAVEHRLDGRDTDLGLPERAAPAEQGLIDGTVAKSYDYFPGSPLPNHWHPYELDTATGTRLYRQARLANPNEAPIVLAPEPRAALLDPPASIHAIDATALPRTGLELTRRWVLARATTGEPLLWMQRHRSPLLKPSTSNLGFDLMEERLNVV